MNKLQCHSVQRIKRTLKFSAYNELAYNELLVLSYKHQSIFGGDFQLQ